MVLWTRTRFRRTPMVFTIELRRFFAAKKIQAWWLSILKKRQLALESELGMQIIR